MPPTVILVGHCGPDSTYLRLAVQKALPDAPLRTAHTPQELDRVLAGIPAEAPPPLLLINRVLEPGFDTDSGVELIEDLRRTRPLARKILVSNYPDAQAAAVAAGALPGFGKRDIGSPKLTALLQAASA